MVRQLLTLDDWLPANAPVDGSVGLPLDDHGYGYEWLIRMGRVCASDLPPLLDGSVCKL